MRVEVVPATSADVLAFCSPDRPVYQMLKVDGTPAAVGALYEAYGRTWAFLDVKSPEIGTARARLVRALYRALRDHGGPVYVLCDAERFATAERLLDVLRFTPTQETHDGKRIWVWQT